MGVRKKTTDIRTYQRKWNMNIGVILFAVILVYVIVEILLSVTNRPTAYYEVGEGAIVKNVSYTGFAVRSEETVASTKDGYLNFFKPEESKLAKGQSVCAVSDDKLDLSSKEEDAGDSQLTDDEKRQLLSSVRTFVDNYRESSFSEVYSVKNTVQNLYDKKTDQNKADRMSATLGEQGEGSYTLCQSPKDGILVYETDGYEDVTIDKVTDKMFDKSGYKRAESRENQKVSEGDDIYKLVTGEEWYLVVRMDADTAESLLKRSSVTIRFLKDDEEMVAGLQIEKKDKDTYYAYLTLDSGLVRYAADRYQDIEIQIENVNGLKIPKSAVVKKTCYQVPSEYVVSNGETGEQGVLIYEDGKTRFQAAEVYYTDTQKNLVCIDAKDLPAGTVIQMQNSNNTRSLTDTIRQSGVYEAGSGYAVFTSIDIAAKNEDYYITGNGVANQISNYDRIVLNAKDVKDDDILV